MSRGQDIASISLTWLVVCPACGLEFKSEGGRDRHVGIVSRSSHALPHELKLYQSHRQKQRLPCRGCNEIFTDAAGLIGHIEDNKCKVIKRNDFYKHRAEQQIEKDAIDELAGSMYQGSTVITSPLTDTDSDPVGGTSLTDNYRVDNPPHWQDPAPPIRDLIEGRQGSVSQGMSEVSVDKYPPLIATREPASRANVPTRRQYVTEYDAEGTRKTSVTASSDLLGSEVSASAQGPKPQDEHPVFAAGPVWNSQNPFPRREAPRQTSQNLLDRESNLLDPSTVSNDSAATQGTRPSQLPGRSDVLPPAAKAENQDPNAPHAQVQTATRIELPSRANLENYWNSVLGCYVCPGYKCDQRLRSVKDFEAHLLAGTHVIEKIRCPSCFKIFKSTKGLVAHAESGSTKCDLRKTEDFDAAIQQITAGLIKVNGSWAGAGNAKFESVPIEDWSKGSSYW